MNVGRALLAAALHITITVVVTTVVVLLIAGVREIPLGTAFETASARALYPRPRLVVGVLSAFFAGWWGAKGLSERRLEQGLLIGILVGLFATVLAFIDHEIPARTVAIMLQTAAAVVGSGMTVLAPPIRRAIVAAGAQIIVTTILFMIISLLAVAWMDETRGEFSASEVGTFEGVLPWLSLLLRTTTAFLAGWWGARGLGSEAAKQGLLIGVLIVGLSIVWITILGGVADAWSVLYMIPTVAATIAGSAVAGLRSHSGPV